MELSQEDKEKDFNERVKLIREAIVEHGDMRALELLRGIAEDAGEDKRFKVALYEWGNCYYCGGGVEENKAEAVKWYKKAAEMGYMEAQFKMASGYFII